MKLALFYLSDSVYGGWITYTCHLVRSLREQGVEVDLYEIKSKTELKRRCFAEEIEYQNLSMEDALSIASEEPSLVHVLGKKHYEVGFPIVKACRGIVVHDTSEVSTKLLDFLKEYEIQPITIRRAVEGFLKEQGIEARTILHPYVPQDLHRIERKKNAVSTARICWDKFTHWILEANEILEKQGLSELRVRLHGFDNRAYSVRKLTPAFPKWREQWAGKFEYGEGPKIAATAKFSVDLSDIRKDGGGSQYTFLEAFDAGTVLVLNKAWLAVQGDVMKDGVNCIGVGGPEELAEVLKSQDTFRKIRAAGYHELENHSPQVIVPQYFEHLEF
jgi:hypothetical protein